MISDFTFVEGDPFRKLLRGEGAVRRFAFFLMVGWLPVVILYLIDMEVTGRRAPEPLLRHFGVHARFLVAIPLFLIAEHSVKPLLVSFLRHIGRVLLPDDDSLEETVDGVRRLVRSPIPLAVLAVLIVALTLRTGYAAPRLDQLSWALVERNGTPALSAAGRWYVYISEPLFGLALAIWLWRLIVLTVLLSRLAHLDLRLAPTHPDGVGGLGFLGEIPVALAPLALGISAVIASRMAHDVSYHGLHVAAVTPYAAGVCIFALAVFLGPFVVFSGKLYALKMRALADYGNLASRHAQLVERKWIRGEPVHDEPLLDSPELGPVVDVNSIYEAVRKMRFVPLTKRSAAMIAAAAVLPFLPVYAIEVPLREMLGKIASALL